MDSIVPSSEHETLDSSPDSASEPEVDFSQDQAVKELKKLLPELETMCEDIRRCFGAISENFHVAHRRLGLVEKTDEDTRASIMEFLYAIKEIKANLNTFDLTSHQIEAATDQMVVGVRGLTDS
jgi:hypothetical protein